ncbi:hypothetical protein PAXRUDRAFT_19341 [Paxillus rubicundulus Ve08.2h10]|uniref:Unplaced genomic scaffold scaffold_3579, whole genome shotgun sequence n=1 Tax=Paxillus rubicundulus Ve08.2h10 TaxID=930991 RepID=A0A0D0CV94_9AGAM|nr:hypothetical protein PAXRUDRAFT_19341 [Paxillus rubicundulus Ve08.2h10]
MSSSITNDLTKWNDEQICEHKDDDNKLFEKKSAECRRRMKAWKEAEHQRVEEEMKRRAEAEAKAKAYTEEVVQAQSSVSGPSKGKQPKAAVSGAAEVVEQAGSLAPCYGCLGAGVACKWLGDIQSMWWRKWEEVMSPWARKKKAWTQSLVVDDDDEYEEEAEDEEVKEERDALGVLTEVLAVVVVEMWDMAAARRRAAEESCAQLERMLGILEEIQGCLDLEYAPDELEVGSEEEFEEEEVVEVAEEREALKGRSEEEAEVDKSV